MNIEIRHFAPGDEALFERIAEGVFDYQVSAAVVAEYLATRWSPSSRRTKLCSARQLKTANALGLTIPQSSRCRSQGEGKKCAREAILVDAGALPFPFPSGWDHEFESAFLQRRVRKLSVPSASLVKHR
jgi:hypothetical protein